MEVAGEMICAEVRLVNGLGKRAAMGLPSLPSLRWLWKSLVLRLASTWMWEETCLRERVLPVRTLM